MINRFSIVIYMTITFLLLFTTVRSTKELRLLWSDYKDSLKEGMN